MIFLGGGHEAGPHLAVLKEGVHLALSSGIIPMRLDGALGVELWLAACK